MADNDLYSLIQSADPETLKMLIAAGLVPEQLGVQKQALGMGQDIMQGAQQPQGQSVGPYHQYVASSPLEHLAAAVRQVQGQRMAQGAMGQEGSLIGQQGAGRLAYLKMLAGQGGGAAGPQGVAPQMVTGDLEP